jgi:hypothetical protein
MQHYSRDVLSFIFLVLTAVNFWKALRAYNKGPDLLNRQQTDEWKGWMQVCLTLKCLTLCQELQDMQSCITPDGMFLDIACPGLPPC